MRRFSISVMWMALLLGVPSSVRCGESMAVDGVAAQVNDNTVTIGDVMMLIQPVRRQLSEKYSGVELKTQLRTAYTNALKTLVERKLILDAYQKQENKFPDTYLNGRIDEIMHDMFNGSRVDLDEALSKEKINYEEWRKEMKDHVIVQTMRRVNVDQNVTIPPLAVRKVYDEHKDRYATPAKVKLRMIVINKSEAGLEKAYEARRQLTKGADFATTAKAVSEDSHAADGGDRGWIEPGILRSELVALVDTLQAGQTSPVKEVGDQVYILKVEDRQDAKTSSFDEVQATIERELRKVESEKAFAAWIERLRKNAYIKVVDTDIF